MGILDIVKQVNCEVGYDSEPGFQIWTRWDLDIVLHDGKRIYAENVEFNEDGSNDVNLSQEIYAEINQILFERNFVELIEQHMNAMRPFVYNHD